MLFGLLCAYLYFKTWTPGLPKGPIPSCATPRRTTLVSNCITLEGLIPIAAWSSCQVLDSKHLKKPMARSQCCKVYKVTKHDETECCPVSKSLRTVAIFLTDRLSRPKNGLFQRLLKPFHGYWTMDNEQEVCAHCRN